MAQRYVCYAPVRRNSLARFACTTHTLWIVQIKRACTVTVAYISRVQVTGITYLLDINIHVLPPSQVIRPSGSSTGRHGRRRYTIRKRRRLTVSWIVSPTKVHIKSWPTSAIHSLLVPPLTNCLSFFVYHPLIESLSSTTQWGNIMYTSLAFRSPASSHHRIYCQKDDKLRTYA
jgi:hypothetical protein